MSVYNKICLLAVLSFASVTRADSEGYAGVTHDECQAVKTAYRTVKCHECPHDTSSPSLDVVLAETRDARAALSSVKMLPYKGSVCVDDAHGVLPTFNITTGDAKNATDFWNTGDGIWNKAITFLHGSKFYPKKINCPAEIYIYLWMTEEFTASVGMAKPPVCDTAYVAFDKYTNFAYDMEYAAGVTPNIQDGRLACYMWPMMDISYASKIPAYCAQPPATKPFADVPSILQPGNMRRFFAGVMAGLQVLNTYDPTYALLTQLLQGLAMMHGSFAYAEAAKIYGATNYPDKMCFPYNGPSRAGCDIGTADAPLVLPDVTTGIEVCVYKDYATTPGPNEITGLLFFQTNFACSGFFNNVALGGHVAADGTNTGAIFASRSGATTLGARKHNLF